MENMLLVLIIIAITEFVVILGMAGRTPDSMPPQWMVPYAVQQSPVETNNGCGPVLFAFLLLGGAAIFLIFLI